MGWHQGAFALKKRVVLLCNYPSGPGKKDIRVAFFLVGEWVALQLLRDLLQGFALGEKF